jgi:hypothetical protein
MRWIAVAVSLCCLLSIGCREIRQTGQDQPLTRQDALELAVHLANEMCMSRFSMAPFDTSTYAIKYLDGIWQWGAFDLKGSSGCSAIVSFDRFGLDPTVDVFLTTDTITPSRDSNQRNEE